MKLFSNKPALPDYAGMPVDERLKDPAWRHVVARVPGFSDATLVANADNGTIIGAGGVTHVTAGILTVTPVRVGYAHLEKSEISQITQPVHKAELYHKGDMFIIEFGDPRNSWVFSSRDHATYLEAFARARS